jgi:disulfide bond formation protein DsbB
VGFLEWYRLFTWLCLATIAAGAVLLVSRTPLAGGLGRIVRAQLDGQGIALGAVVASVATAGSLYLSEGAHLPPCRLCWFQRCAMYPLAVILIVAAIRRDRAVRPFAITLAIIGALISSWHTAVEWRPSLEGIGGSCAIDLPCSARLVPLAYGFISVPVMALSAFVLTALLVADDRPRRPITRPEETPL